MAVSFVSASSAEADNGYSVTPALPSSWAVGDLLVAVCYAATSTILSTPPSGWTLFASHTGTFPCAGAIFYKTAAAGETAPTFTLASSPSYQNLGVALFSFRGARSTLPLATASWTDYQTSSSTFTAGSQSANAGDALALVYVNDYGVFPSTAPAGVSPATQSARNVCVAGYVGSPGSGPTGAKSVTYPSSVQGLALSLRVLTPNVAPNAPAWLTPNNTAVPYDQDNVLAWRFSDDDPGDSQSAYNIKRWTLNGSGARVGSPVTVYKPIPQQQYTLPANTLTLGTKYEFQVDTLDSQGAEGPYSTSLFLTAAASPDGPILTDPINGQTISTDSYTGVVSVPNADATEWTLCSDNNGVIDTSTIIQGPIVVSTGDIRSHTFTGLANNTPVWWSVRDRYQGLWSQPAQSRTPVSFTPPPVPVVTTMEDSAHGVMVVGIANPLPAGEQPGVAYNNVWIDDADGKGLIRKAVDLPTNTPWTYWLPPSGFDGATVGVIQVEAVGTNGTSSWSSPPTPAPVYEDLDGGTATTAGTDFLDGGSI